MGDRGNIFLVQSPLDRRTESVPMVGIYVYSHWGGTYLPERLREALLFAESRWGDYQYLNRIIISQVFMDSHNSTTGAGISLNLCDNEHDIIICDVFKEEVSFAKRGDETNPSNWFNTLSFGEYTSLEEAKFPEASYA